MPRTGPPPRLIKFQLVLKIAHGSADQAFLGSREKTCSIPVTRTRRPDARDPLQRAEVTERERMANEQPRSDIASSCRSLMVLAGRQGAKGGRKPRVCYRCFAGRMLGSWAQEPWTCEAAVSWFSDCRSGSVSFYFPLFIPVFEYARGFDPANGFG